MPRGPASTFSETAGDGSAGDHGIDLLAASALRVIRPCRPFGQQAIGVYLEDVCDDDIKSVPDETASEIPPEISEADNAVFH